MDDLAEIIETSLEVNPSSSKKAGEPISRLSQYKAINRNVSSHDNRRQKVLEDQKQRRDDVLAQFRGLLEEFYLEDEDLMEWTNTQAERKTHKKNPKFTKQLMFSEWFLDIPCDVDTNWIVKPCPVGTRTLLVAGKGKTLSYYKSGKLQRVLDTCLPGGNRSEKNFKHMNYVVLDCIYNSETQVHYVLDVLYWKFAMLPHTAEFRFYWLKTQLNDRFLEFGGSDQNFAKIVLLPHYPTSELPALMASYPIFPNNTPELDGLLFYHQLGLYEPGRTPLVGWIKPFMILDKFNIPVNEAYLEEKDSIDVLKLIEKENKQYYAKSKGHKKSYRKKRSKIKMEEERPLKHHEDLMEASQLEAEN